MALTTIETIAEKLQQQKDTELEHILSVSGSSAITKNEYGINVVTNDNAASSLIFKNLSKPKYDEVELLKAINVEVKELKPDIPVPNLDLVPKPIYDAEVLVSEDLRKQVNLLNVKVDTLNSTITTLQSQVQSEINNRLTIEQTNDVLVNQLETLTGTIDDFSSQIGTSLQKSVDESILRASLQSQNTGFKAQIEALIKQIDSLNSIIEGLQAQLGAVQQQQAIQQSTQNLAFAQGADAVNEVVIAKWSPKDAEVAGNTVRVRFKNNTGYTKFDWGNTLDLNNNDKAPVSITLQHTYEDGQNFLTIPETAFVLEPGAAKSIKLQANLRGCKYGSKDRSKEANGKFIIKVKRADGTEKSKEYKTKVQIMHPSSM